MTRTQPRGRAEAEALLNMVRRAPASYDPKCHELAHHFLCEEPNATDKHTDELATLIQQTIEDYIEYEMRGDRK